MRRKITYFVFVFMCLLLLPLNIHAAFKDANGTYSYATGPATLVINFTQSGFQCSGPQVGVEHFAVLSVGETEMVWEYQGEYGPEQITWIRPGGAPGDMIGVWMLNNGPAFFTLIINPDGSFYIFGNDECGSADASGTYNYYPITYALQINALYSTFECSGPGVGVDNITVLSIGETTMEWVKEDGDGTERITWTRPGGIPGDISGQWTMTNGPVILTLDILTGDPSSPADAMFFISGEDYCGDYALAEGTFIYIPDDPVNPVQGFLIISVFQSSFECTGPQDGDMFRVVYLDETTMGWEYPGEYGPQQLTWYRELGTAGDMTGTWTMINGPVIRTLQINPDLSYTVSGNDYCDETGGCTDNDGDGFAIEGGDCGPADCNDSNPIVNPGAAEIPMNGVEDDCNEATRDSSQAAGSYEYDSDSGELALYFDWSDFQCNGPESGEEYFRVLSIDEMTMVWEGEEEDGGIYRMTWTREPGSAGDISGIWTINEGDGVITLQIDGEEYTFLVTGADSCAGAGSDHRPDGYYGQFSYEDPGHEAASVSVTGPGIEGSLPLVYDEEEGEWNVWTGDASQLYFGEGHPDLPAVYVFEINGPSGTMRIQSEITCFMEALPSIISPPVTLDSQTWFQWTGVSQADVMYRVWMDNYWKSQTVLSTYEGGEGSDDYRINYDGYEDLSPEVTYYYSVTAMGPGRCSATVSDSFMISRCTDNDDDGYNAEGGDCGPADCDDSDAAVHPDAEEIPNNDIDEDCDGVKFMDADADGIPDEDDNCSLTPNPGQQDTDADGYGNACDANLDSDNVVGFRDFNIFKAAWLSNPSSANWNPNADFDSDNVVGFKDFNIFKSRWLTSAPWR